MSVRGTLSRLEHGVMACAFCGGPGPIRQSHLIPRFVIQRMRQDAGGSAFRLITDINRPIQQAYVKPWLCSRCEQRFGRSEKYFAEKVDRPWNEDSLSSFVVGKPIMDFLSALAWKICAWQFEDDDGLAEAARVAISWAKFSLKQYLDGEAPLPPFIHHHLYFPSLYEGPRRGINTLYRASFLPTLVGTHQCLYTFVAMGGYISITILNADRYDAREWDGGTRVRLGEMLKTRGQYIDSPIFHGDLDEMAKQERLANALMSNRQRQKVLARHSKAQGRLAGSKAFQAILKDRENRLQFGPYPDDGDI